MAHYTGYFYGWRTYPRSSPGGRLKRMKLPPSDITSWGYEVISGSAPNALSAEIAFSQVIKYVMVLTQNADIDIEFITQQGASSTRIGESGFLDYVSARGFKVKNHVSGSIATYQVVGFY